MEKAQRSNKKRGFLPGSGFILWDNELKQAYIIREAGYGSLGCRVVRRGDWINIIQRIGELFLRYGVCDCGERVIWY
jgi:hypothetical protein